MKHLACRYKVSYKKAVNIRTQIMNVKKQKVNNKGVVDDKTKI